MSPTLRRSFVASRAEIEAVRFPGPPLRTISAMLTTRRTELWRYGDCPLAARVLLEQLSHSKGRCLVDPEDQQGLTGVQRLARVSNEFLGNQGAQLVRMRRAHDLAPLRPHATVLQNECTSELGGFAIGERGDQRLVQD